MPIVRAWNRYWFGEGSTFSLAVVRIALVGFQMFLLVERDLLAYAKKINTTAHSLYDPLVSFRMLTLPLGFEGATTRLVGPWSYRPSDLHLEIVYFTTIAFGLLALVGFRTRPALAAFAFGNLFLQSFFYSFGERHHPEAILLITLAVLPFAPAGASLSLDDLRARLRRVDLASRLERTDLLTERSRFARWPLLVVAWLLSLAYVSSAISKWERAGMDWLNGYTLQFYLLQDGLRFGSDLGIWLGSQHVPVVIMSWMTCIWEATFWLVLLFPALAIVYVPLGAGFHAGTHFFMRATFWQFHALYTVFVPWDLLAGWLRRKTAPGARPIVLYDGHCPICLRSMTIIRYADVLERICLEDLESASEERLATIGAPHGRAREALRHEMHVVSPEGMISKGFFAFRRVVRELPQLWPLLVVLHLPGAGRLGATIYRRVARSRLRVGGCVDGTCGVRGPRGD